MPQTIPVRRGDTKTLHFIVRTLTNEFLDLTGWDEARLCLYDDAYSSTIVLALSTNDPSEGEFIDPLRGQVNFYLTATDSGVLDVRQYPFRMMLFKTTDKRYTVYEGVLEVNP